MNVLVIGGLGYIGSHVVIALREAGHDVSVFDDLSTGQLANQQPGSKFIKGDILDKPALDAAFAEVRPDAVIHLAGKKAVGESMENPNLYSVNNITGTLNILAAMAEYNVKKIVFSSTATVYGGVEGNMLLTEDTPTNPSNFYGFTKLEAERAMTWYDRLKGIKFAVLRYFNAVGYDAAGRVPGLEIGSQNLLPIVMEIACGRRVKPLQLFGNDYPTPDGTCVRDYVHCTDLADAHVRALSLKDSVTLNLGTGRGTSVLEMIAMVEKVTGRKVPYDMVARRSGDPAKLVAATDLAKKNLGWSAVHSDLENIVKTTWANYR